MPNFLNRAFNSFFADRAQTIVGIDIGSSAIKVVQARKDHGSAVLQTYGSLALGPYGDTDVGRIVQLPRDMAVSAIKDLFKESGISTKECCMALPIQTSLVAFIDMPDLPERQLASMIPIEARKYIPVPIHEVSLDWMLIPYHKEQEEATDNENNKKSNSSKRIGVLIVAIHNEALQDYRQIAADLDLNVRFLELELFSAIRSTSIHNNSAPILIFDMGAAVTKLYIVQAGIIRNSHSINRGAQEITVSMSRALGIPFSQAESLKRSSGLRDKANNQALSEIMPLPTEHIFNEANKLILSYQKKYNQVVNKIVLVGGGILLPGFIEYAMTKFDFEVVLGEPFLHFSASDYLDPLLKEAGPEFAVATGLVLRALQEMP
jgi:type IV pilus assembly protein PilM